MSGVLTNNILASSFVLPASLAFIANSLDSGVNLLAASLENKSPSPFANNAANWYGSFLPTLSYKGLPFTLGSSNNLSLNLLDSAKFVSLSSVKMSVCNLLKGCSIPCNPARIAWGA